MNSEVKEIINKINQTHIFKDYTEFTLKKDVNMNTPEMKQLIKDLNNEKNTTAYYNSVTKNCDTIAVIDVHGSRYIDFDDNYYTLLNKGIDRQTNKID